MHSMVTIIIVDLHFGGLVDIKIFGFFVCTGTSKNYHEHLRRTALGKITDEIKLKYKKNFEKNE